MKMPLLLGLLCTPMLNVTPTQAAEWPGDEWARATPAEMGLDAAQLAKARDYALSGGGGSGCIVYRGKMVLNWGDAATLYDLKSSGKSIGSTALGLALKDGKVQLDDPAQKYHPTFGLPPESNAQTGWIPKITLRMLANQTAGFGKPGGYEPLLFEPGTQWSYSDGGPNWLAECLTLVYKRDLNDVLFERVFAPLGIKNTDLVWRKQAYRPELLDGIRRREFGSGFSADVEAMARIGYLYLRDGRWKDEQILPAAFIGAIHHPDPALAKLPVREPTEYGKASSHYSMLWWNNADGTIAEMPRDAFWSWGLYDSLIVVVPSLDLVVARAGKSWNREKNNDHYDVLKPFFRPLAAAVPKRAAAYPPSPVIANIDWEAPAGIARRAEGSDNWPMTWASDDALYTAYGDGQGFVPFVKSKLSMGLAKVTGAPPNFEGTNISAPTAEALGNGKDGRKASGILMVKGVLYLLVRNAANAQLGWSNDRGATWQWADWKFTESFGCPTFLNFGQNYGNARDGFVYLYSPDSDSAYVRTDRMVLARVPLDKIRERDAYEFFVKIGAGGEPQWSRDIKQRGAVFENAGACYRGGVSYDAALKRYLWCQIGLPNDAGFGGFAIYDAPSPWGPWTTAYYTQSWDVDPGDTASLPTKWMSDDGRTLHLVFSGDDCFAVRRGTLSLKP